MSKEVTRKGYIKKQIESLDLNSAVNAKVTDFGASKILQTSNEVLSTDVGTVRYMPPEVISRSKNSNEKIDVYSFGIGYLPPPLPFIIIICYS